MSVWPAAYSVVFFSDESNDVQSKDDIDDEANEPQDDGDEATDTAVDEEAADSEDPGEKKINLTTCFHVTFSVVFLPSS